MLDIVFKNGPPGGLRCAEIGAGTGGLTRRASSPSFFLFFGAPCVRIHEDAGNIVPW